LLVLAQDHRDISEAEVPVAMLALAADARCRGMPGRAAHSGLRGRRLKRPPGAKGLLCRWPKDWPSAGAQLHKDVILDFKDASSADDSN